MKQQAPVAPIVAKEVHFHVCEACRHVWGHAQVAPAQSWAAHLCPRCSCGPYRRAFWTKPTAAFFSALLLLKPQRGSRKRRSP